MSETGSTLGENNIAVQASAVRKRLRGAEVLRGVDFTMRAGESMAIAGINGAGKTTLLRCLLDFMPPDSGSIEIFGRSSRDHRARAALAYLPERFVPSPHLTGRETLAMLAALHDQRWSQDEIAQVLQRLQYPSDALRRPVRQHSKGMTQKLGLAAMILARKPLLVLDEPMSGLDPLARRLLLQVLQQLRDEGRALLFTSHAPRDIAQLADRLLVLHDGLPRFVGTPAALMQAQRCTDLEDAFLRCIESSAAEAAA